MKKLLPIVLMLVLASIAYGANMYTAGNASNSVLLPAAGGFATVYAVNFVGGAATVDMLVYTGDSTETELANAESATATALTLDECGGLDDSDILVIMNTDGGTIEAVTMSACNDTTNVATVGALSNTYRSGAKVYEMKLLTTWADVTTTRINIEGDIWQSDLRNKPIYILLNGSGGTFHYMTGGWE